MRLDNLARLESDLCTLGLTIYQWHNILETKFKSKIYHEVETTSTFATALKQLAVRSLLQARPLRHI